MKNKLDSLFFTRLFVSEQKQIALMARHKKHASENLKFSSPLRNKLLRNEDYYEFYIFKPASFSGRHQT